MKGFPGGAARAGRGAGTVLALLGWGVPSPPVLACRARVWLCGLLVSNPEPAASGFGAALRWLSSLRGVASFLACLL